MTFQGLGSVVFMQQILDRHGQLSKKCLTSAVVVLQWFHRLRKRDNK